MNILAVGAHHDDIELGCGGTLARLKTEGHSIFGMTLTDSETHYDIRSIHRSAIDARNEAHSAAAVIGLSIVDLGDVCGSNGMLAYEVTVMRRIEQFIADNSISMVFSHWTCDLNTDHQAAAKMTIVASRHTPCVLMYRSNWYQASTAFNGIFFVDISATIDCKRQSLGCYRSEIENRGQAWIDSFIDGNRTSGFSIGRQYAEVFEPVRYELFHQ